MGFALAVGLGASGLNQFASNPWLNLGVTALFLFFAMSLFGIYEVALPSSVVTAACRRADSGKGRYAGTILMGFAFTLTSFTCTAPFLGTLLVLAAQGQWQWPLAGMLAFSSVFALPLRDPRARAADDQFASRSGGWLLSVKASMGLLPGELAAAFKFLSNVDLVWGWHIFTRTTVLVAWVIIAIALMLYLLGAFKLGHAPRLSKPGPARLAISAACLLRFPSCGLRQRRDRSSSRWFSRRSCCRPISPIDRIRKSGELAWILNDYDARRSRNRSARIARFSWTSPATPAPTAAGWKPTCSRVPM